METAKWEEDWQERWGEEGSELGDSTWPTYGRSRISGWWNLWLWLQGFATLWSTPGNRRNSASRNLSIELTRGESGIPPRTSSTPSIPSPGGSGKGSFNLPRHKYDFLTSLSGYPPFWTQVNLRVVRCGETPSYGLLTRQIKWTLPSVISAKTDNADLRRNQWESDWKKTELGLEIWNGDQWLIRRGKWWTMRKLEVDLKSESNKCWLVSE